MSEELPFQEDSEINTLEIPPGITEIAFVTTAESLALLMTKEKAAEFQTHRYLLENRFFTPDGIQANYNLQYHTRSQRLSINIEAQADGKPILICNIDLEPFTVTLHPQTANYGSDYILETMDKLAESVEAANSYQDQIRRITTEIINALTQS